MKGDKDQNKGAFLRSDEMSWVSSSLFFMSINKLSINDKIFHIPVGVKLNNEELKYYINYLYDELAGLETSTNEEKEARDYVRKVASILRTWADAGYNVKMV